MSFQTHIIVIVFAGNRMCIGGAQAKCCAHSVVEKLD